MKKFLLVMMLITFVDIYLGVPISVAKTPTHWRGDVGWKGSIEATDIMKLVRGFSIRAAVPLEYVGIPIGGLKHAPTVVMNEKLVFSDALINFAAVISFATFLVLFGLFGGLVGIVYGIINLEWLAFFQAFAIAVLIPLGFIVFIPLGAIGGLMFEEATTAYTVTMYLLTAIAAIPYAIIILTGLAALLSGLEGFSGSAASRANGGADGSSPPSSASNTITRIHPRTGVIEEKGIFWWNDTGTRINRKTGVLEKRTLFLGWKPNDKRSK